MPTRVSEPDALDVEPAAAAADLPLSSHPWPVERAMKAG